MQSSNGMSKAESSSIPASLASSVPSILPQHTTASAAAAVAAAFVDADSPKEAAAAPAEASSAKELPVLCDGMLHRIVTDNGKEYFLDDDTYSQHVIMSRAAAEHGIPYFGIFDVTKTISQASAVAARYLDALKSGDTTVINWERLGDVIKSGDIGEFRRIANADPGMLDRIGTPVLGTRPIHVAAAYIKALPILEWLLNQPGVQINAVSASQRTPLAYAVSKGNLQAVETLLHRPDCDRSAVCKTAIPPYVPNAGLTDSMIDAMERIYELLPETHESWDPRWSMFFRFRKGDPEAIAAVEPSKVPVSAPQSTSGAPAAAPAPASSVPPASVPVPTSAPMPACDMQCDTSSSDVADVCVVCLSTKPDTIALPCGHKVVCSACSKKLASDPSPNRYHCVYCKTPLEGVYLMTEDKIQNQP